MALDSAAIIEGLADHAATLGRFEKVIRHEPRVAPGTGVSLSLFLHELEPVQHYSGLATTSARLQVTARVAINMFYEPQDDLDPKILGGAVDALFNAYTGDFTLDGLVHKIDLLGDGGEGMKARFGYLEQDKKLYRIADILLPIVINDVWEQVA